MAESHHKTPPKEGYTTISIANPRTMCHQRNESRVVQRAKCRWLHHHHCEATSRKERDLDMKGVRAVADLLYRGHQRRKHLVSSIKY
ncbi:hypothetical protein TSUD_128660 [Trifolium subterraneum]|uniref:Uncharacterized protein n=1 Tax=Trifolium subterraneum TaxID=3900 RepID=A0A2Z6LW57_TRISU|nr:hypothetical protein TSUD_128660 [Trifolium subterraneum]